MARNGKNKATEGEAKDCQDNGGQQMAKKDIIRLVIQTVQEELAKEKAGKISVDRNDGNETNTGNKDGKIITTTTENDYRGKLKALQVVYNTLQIESAWYKAEVEKLKKQRTTQMQTKIQTMPGLRQWTKGSHLQIQP